MLQSTLNGFPNSSVVKNLPAMQETQESWVRLLGWEDPLEKEMAAHSSILAWKILWTWEPGGYSPQGSKELDMTERAHTHTPLTGNAAAAAAAKWLQLYPTLCNPIDGSPPGSPVPGILQARTLEWVAISFSNA